MKNRERSKSESSITPVVCRVQQKSNGQSKINNTPEEMACITEELLLHFHDDMSKSLSPGDKFHVLLYGDPGSGKTSVINFIERTITETKQFDKIIHLDFNLLNNNSWKEKYSTDLIKNNFLECFIHFCSGASSKKSIETEISNIVRLTYSSKIIIIVDGYNKAFNQHNIMLDEVFKYKNLIVTSRTISEKLKEHEFDLSLKQIGFEEYQIRTFIDQINPGSKLIDLIFKYNEIHEIAKNPFYLQLISKLWSSRYEELIDYSNYKITVTVLYEDIVHSIFAKYLMDIEEKTDEYSLGYHYIHNHPLMQMLQEKAFNDVFGFSNPDIIGKYRDQIINAIPNHPTLITIPQVLDMLGLVNYKPDNKLGSSFIFYQNNFREFLAANHLLHLLVSGNSELILKAKGIISSAAIKHEHLLILKFLSGLILTIKDAGQKEEIKEIFWQSIINDDNQIIKIHGDYSIKLLMHLLSQTIKNHDLVPDAPEYIVSQVNQRIETEPTKWTKVIIESQYITNGIIAFLSNTLENKSLLIEIFSSLDHQFPNLLELIQNELRNSHNPKIIALAIESLKKLSSNPEAQEILVNLLNSDHKLTELLTIQTTGTIASEKYIDLLLKKLTSPQILVVLETLEALKNYKDSPSSERIVEKIISKMSERGTHKDIIVNKCLETLQSLGMTLNKLENKLLELYDPYKDDTYVYMNVLTNIYDQKLEYQRVDNQEQVYNIWQSKFKITWGHKVNCKGRIVELVSFKYDHLKIELRDNFFNWIHSKFTTPQIWSDQNVKNAMLDAIGNMFVHLNPEQRDKAFEILTNRNSLESRITAVYNFHKILIHLGSAEQIIKLQNKIIDKLENKIHPRLKEAVLEELNKIKIEIDKQPGSIIFFENIVNYFIAKLDSLPDEKVENIELLGKLSKYANASQLQILEEKFLGYLQENISTQISYECVIALQNIIKLLNTNNIAIAEDKLTELYNIMQSTIEYVNSLIATNERAPLDKKSTINNEVEQQKIAHEIIGNLINLMDNKDLIEQAIGFLLTELKNPSTKTDIKPHIINGMTAGITKLDESLTPIIEYLICLPDIDDASYLSIVHLIYNAKLHNLIEESLNQEIILFLNRENFTFEIQDAQKWTLLGFIEHLSDEAQFPKLEFIINQHAKNYLKVNSPEQQNYILKAYTLLLSQLIELENQAAHRLMSTLLLNIKITPEFLKNFINEIISTDNELREIQLLSNLKLIFLHSPELVEIIHNVLEDLKAHSPIISENEDLQSFITRVVTPETNYRKLDLAITKDGKLYIDGIKASSRIGLTKNTLEVLKKSTLIKSDAHKPNHFSLIDGKKLSETMLKVSILLSDDGLVIITEEITEFNQIRLTKIQDPAEAPEFFEDAVSISKQLIFGASSSSKKYQFSTKNLSQNDLEKLIENYKKTGQISLDTPSRELQQNDLIGLNDRIFSSLDTIDKKLDRVSGNIDEQHKLIIKKLEDLTLKSDQIHNLIKNLNSLAHISSPTGFNAYQKSLYSTIVKQLVANYLMAVTMVYDPDTLLSRASSLFSIAGEIIPIAGPGLKFLGLITDSINQIQNDSIIENIANLALTSGDMEVLAKKIATLFATNKINLDHFPKPNSIIDLLKTIIDNTSREAITQKIIELCAEAATKSSADTDAALGEEHAMLIVNNILMPYIIAGNLESQIGKEEINFNILKDHITSQGFIEILQSDTNYSIHLDPEDLSLYDLCEPIPLLRISRSISRDLMQDSQTSPDNTIVRSSSESDIANLEKSFVSSPSETTEDIRYKNLFVTESHDMPNSPGKLPLLTLTNSVPNSANNAPQEDVAFDYDQYIAFTGAGILNYANSIPSLKYLATHYIPIMPYINAAYDYLGITEYSNEINTMIYSAGAMLIGCAVGYCFASAPFMAIYYLQPHAYQTRNMILNQIKQYDYAEGSYLYNSIKFITYIGTDIVLTTSISSPLTSLDKAATLSSIAWGAAMGAMHYFEESTEPCSFANNTAFIATTLAGAFTVYKLQDPLNILLYLPAIPAAMATTHYSSKFITNKLYNYLYPENTGNNSFIGEQHTSSTQTEL